jgi:hypothetical protein
LASTFKILVLGDVLIRKTNNPKYNGSAKRGKAIEKRTFVRKIHII